MIVLRARVAEELRQRVVDVGEVEALVEDADAVHRRGHRRGLRAAASPRRALRSVMSVATWRKPVRQPSSSRSAVTERRTVIGSPSLRDVGPLALFESFARGAADEDVEAAEFFAELEGQPRARAATSSVSTMQLGDVARADDVGGGVAEHPLRAGVEDGDDAVRVGGDDGDARGGVEHRFALRVRGGDLLLGQLALGDVEDESFEDLGAFVQIDGVRVELHPDRRAVFLAPQQLFFDGVAVRGEALRSSSSRSRSVDVDVGRRDCAAAALRSSRSRGCAPASGWP